jgi:hypothetical protein
VYRPDRGKGPVDTLAAMISEFNWWLLLLGLVVGGGLTWLVLAETRRREQDLEDVDLADEAVWLEERLAEEGRALSPDTIERVVQLHREYLAVVPPVDVADDWRPDELAATDDNAWPAVGWEEARTASLGTEPAPSERAAPEPPEPEPPVPEQTPLERTAPDEPGVRHEAGGG